MKPYLGKVLQQSVIASRIFLASNRSKHRGARDQFANPHVSTPFKLVPVCTPDCPRPVVVTSVGVGGHGMWSAKKMIGNSADGHRTTNPHRTGALNGIDKLLTVRNAMCFPMPCSTLYIVIVYIQHRRFLFLATSPSRSYYQTPMPMIRNSYEENGFRSTNIFA